MVSSPSKIQRFRHVGWLVQIGRSYLPFALAARRNDRCLASARQNYANLRSLPEITKMWIVEFESQPQIFRISLLTLKGGI
jgi:hypothetical protein